MYLSLFVGFCVWSLFCYALLSVLSSFALIWTRMGELVVVALIVFMICCDCWFFLMVP